MKKGGCWRRRIEQQLYVIARLQDVFKCVGAMANHVCMIIVDQMLNEQNETDEAAPTAMRDSAMARLLQVMTDNDQIAYLFAHYLPANFKCVFVVDVPTTTAMPYALCCRPEVGI